MRALAPHCQAANRRRTERRPARLAQRALRQPAHLASARDCFHIRRRKPTTVRKLIWSVDESARQDAQESLPSQTNIAPHCEQSFPWFVLARLATGSIPPAWFPRPVPACLLFPPSRALPS